MVLGANSMPIGIHNWGAVKENVFSAEQFNGDTARLWKQQGCEAALGKLGGCGHAPFSEALLHSVLVCLSGPVQVCFALLLWDVCSVSTPVFGGKGKRTPWARGKLAYVDRSPHPCSDWPILMQVRAPILALELVRKARPYRSEWTFSVGWWRCGGDSWATLTGWGSLSPMGWNRLLGPQGLAPMQEQCRKAGSSVQASPWSALCMRGPCVETAARLCFLFICFLI